MSYLKKELDRLIKFSEGLGVKVRFHKDKMNNDAGAEWDLSGKEIIIYYRDDESTTSLILKLVHELGHHLDYVNNKRRHTKQIEEAVSAENPTKTQRRILYKDERNAAKYHEFIYDTVGIKIPRWKIVVEREWSLEVYRQEIYNPEGPSKKEKRDIRKRLTEKYKV